MIKDAISYKNLSGEDGRSILRETANEKLGAMEEPHWLEVGFYTSKHDHHRTIVVLIHSGEIIDCVSNTVKEGVFIHSYIHR
jgi:hypothetical protein